MKSTCKVIFFAFIISFVGMLAYSANRYHDQYQEEKLRADAAVHEANVAFALTGNIIRTIDIFNSISEVNQNAKQHVAMGAQKAVQNIKVAVANDDCAEQLVPTVAADWLRQYANSLRTGPVSSTTGKPNN